jgi:hypothetical protein
MSERLAVLARHLAAPGRGEQQQIAAAMPTSSSSLSPLSPSAQQQLSAFCPRELSRFMTHDNHELRGRIQDFLKVSFLRWSGGVERGRKREREKPMGKRGGRRKAGVVDGPSSSPFDGRGASFSHVPFCLSLAAEACAMSCRHRCHAENREK